MDRKDLRDIENSLGIQSPWTIKLLRYNDRNKCFDLAIEGVDKKRKFALLGASKASKASKDDDLVVGHWRYANLGFHPCVIHAKVPKSISLDGLPISRDVISQPAFFGNPSRNYSNYIRQQVALANIKGYDLGALKSALGITDSVVQQILSDIESTSLAGKQLAYLPTEIDPVWEKILNNSLTIKTQLLPLKFLLSRLTLIANKNPAPDSIAKLKFELRKFFLDNYTQLEKEIEQICGITSTKLQQQSRSIKAKQRLVLPSTTNKVWLDLLGGNINLHSNNMALNLLIFRQRNVFTRAVDESEKQTAIETLRGYFKKNYRNLIKELVTLNNALQSSKNRSDLDLPQVEHGVWQKILEDESFIPSDHMAYRLLLAKLRAEVSTKPDPSIKLQAARRIRDFIGQNQKTMRIEVGALMQQVAAV